MPGRVAEGAIDHGQGVNVLVGGDDVAQIPADVDALSEADRAGNGGHLLLACVVELVKGAIAGVVHGAGLLFGQVLNGERLLAGVSVDRKRAYLVVEAVADVVKGVHDLQGAGGGQPRILNRDQDPIGQLTRRQITPGEVERLTASGEKERNSAHRGEHKTKY